jgi:hypothetical protein
MALEFYFLKNSLNITNAPEDYTQNYKAYNKDGT